ncbi:MAG: PDZ domain-containing protein [Candidatus Muiribacteriota bacterium]
MIKKTFIILLIIIMNFSIEGADPENFIVEIKSISQSYLEYIPWQRTSVRNRSGNGVVINNEYVLTTADLIKNNVLVELKKQGKNNVWEGYVLHADYDAGLALVKPVNDEFFEGLEVPEFSSNYSKGSPLTIGRRLSDGRLAYHQAALTEIDARSILYGSNIYLALKANTMMQRGGNSEIAFNNKGEIIGLCYSFGDNEVNIIPYETIENYINNYSTDEYSGFPANYLKKLPLNDDNLRDFLELTDDKTGVMIANYNMGMPYSEFFKKYDVLLKVEGYDVDNSGLIKSDKFGRIDFNILFNIDKQPGDFLNVEIFRDGKVLNEKLKLDKFNKDDYLIPDHILDERPDFIVYGGLLMSELTKSFLQEWGSEWVKRAPVKLVKKYSDYFMRKSDTKDNIVILREVFAHDINRGYQNLSYMIISKVNDVPVSHLKDVKKALNKNVEYDVIEFENTAFKVVFKRDEVLKSNYNIEKIYSITESQYFSE